MIRYLTYVFYLYKVTNVNKIVDHLFCYDAWFVVYMFDVYIMFISIVVYNGSVAIVIFV